ncbi:MAG: hypothetical protein WBG92_23765 [Thiohalocapsa sp.]
MDSTVWWGVGIFVVLVLGVIGAAATRAEARRAGSFASSLRGGKPRAKVFRRKEDDPLYHTHQYERAKAREQRRPFIYYGAFLVVVGMFGVWLAVPEDTLAWFAEHGLTLLLFTLLPGTTLALGAHFNQVYRRDAPGLLSMWVAGLLVVVGIVRWMS